MGKRRKFDKGPQKRKEASPDYNEGCLLDPSARDYIYDDVDNFHENEDSQILLEAQGRMAKREIREEQVLGIGGYSSSEESIEESDVELSASDIESTEEKERDEDERMMGKKKQNYFGTDITDERIHKESRYKSKKRGDALLLEEEGAKQLQNRMASQLEGLSFSDLLPQVSKEKPIKTKEQDPEASPPSKRKTLKALKKNSPELLPIFEDLQEKSEELNTKLFPLIQAKQKNLLMDDSPSVQYLQTRYFLCLNYLTAISSYMMVKCSGAQLNQHPAVSRLAQYRHLLKEMEPCDMKYGPELDNLLDDLHAGKLEEPIKKKQKKYRKMLNILKVKGDEKNVENKEEELEASDDEDEMLDEVEEQKSNDDDSLSESEQNIAEESHDNEVEDPSAAVSDSRRVITYQISKNKGLMPSRKKDQRNPRVRYKNKYQNKLKRRKGQVRMVRKELQRYEGEISGIKANLIKSIKLK